MVDIMETVDSNVDKVDNTVENNFDDIDNTVDNNLDSNNPLIGKKEDKKKNFLCQVCNKAFRDNYKLKRHEKVHIKSGELVNPSEDCSYLEDEKPLHSGTFDLNSFHFVMKIIDGHINVSSVLEF